MGNRKTIGSYIGSENEVVGERFLGSFGSQDGDLREYVVEAPGFIGANFLTMNVRLEDGVYCGKKQFQVIVDNHQGDYAADA